MFRHWVRRLPNLLRLILSLTLSLAAFTQTRPSANEPASVAVAKLPAASTPGYAGAERCATCHDAEAKAYSKTAHARLNTGKDTITGCEVCYGPGLAHAESYENGEPNPMSPAEQ